MPAPDGLGRRGAALWESMGFDVNTPNGVMALEAARLADRLDELDSVIHGKGVLELMKFRVLDGDDERRLHVEVTFNNVLGEARQQQNVLRQMLVTLTAASDAAPAKGEPPAPAPSVADEFTKRRRSRGA